LLHEALHAAEGIDAADERSNALKVLVTHLSTLLARPGMEGLSDCQRRRRDVLRILAPHLAEEQIPDAVQTMLSMPDRRSYGWTALEALVPRLSGIFRRNLYPL
jgi:hypothetical protein